MTPGRKGRAMSDPTETQEITPEPEAKEEKRVGFGIYKLPVSLAKKILKTTLKVAMLPLGFMAFEAGQFIIGVSLLGLLVPLPRPTILTGLGAYGGWILLRYLSRETYASLRGKGKTAFSGANDMVQAAAIETAMKRAGRSRPRPSGGP